MARRVGLSDAYALTDSLRGASGNRGVSLVDHAVVVGVEEPARPEHQKVLPVVSHALAKVTPEESLNRSATSSNHWKTLPFPFEALSHSVPGG